MGGDVWLSEVVLFCRRVLPLGGGDLTRREGQGVKGSNGP